MPCQVPGQFVAASDISHLSQVLRGVELVEPATDELGLPWAAVSLQERIAVEFLLLGAATEYDIHNPVRMPIDINPLGYQNLADTGLQGGTLLLGLWNTC